MFGSHCACILSMLQICCFHQSTVLVNIAFVFTYLCTHSMEQSPSWEANWFTASQEIPCILWNPRRFITAFPSARYLSLSWASSIQSIPPHPTSWRSILIFSSHLHLVLPSGLFTQVSPPKPCTRLSPLRTCYIPHLSYSRFYHLHNIGWGVSFHI